MVRWINSPSLHRYTHKTTAFHAAQGIAQSPFSAPFHRSRQRNLCPTYSRRKTTSTPASRIDNWSHVAGLLPVDRTRHGSCNMH